MAMRRFVGINLGREPASRLFDELQRQPGGGHRHDR